MARSSRSRSSSTDSVQSSNQPLTSSSGNNGIMGSGIFGHFGSFVNCNSQDNSMYCNFVKFFNILIMLSAIIGIIYFIYIFVSPYFIKKRNK